jgi:starch synthase
VASIPNAKLQVYFIDNEDYFQRKSVFTDKADKFFEDNDERAVFFCKGVMETVKKLGWAPDIVHCNDWMTSLVPLYLKTRYKLDPVFKNAKSVFSIHNNSFKHKFEGDLRSKVKMSEIDDSMLDHLETQDYEGFLKIGMAYADAVIGTDKEFATEVTRLFKDMGEKKKKVNTFPLTEEGIEEKYYEFYTELAGN